MPVVRGERAAVERAQEDGAFTARKAFHKGFKEQGTHSPRHGGDARRAFGACKNAPSRFFWSADMKLEWMRPKRLLNRCRVALAGVFHPQRKVATGFFTDNDPARRSKPRGRRGDWCLMNYMNR